MESIILAVAKKQSTISVREIARKTGFSEKEVKAVLYSLYLKEKINLIDARTLYRNVCDKCPLNKICHRNNKGGVKIGIN